jgi:hypothetical protein
VARRGGEADRQRDGGEQEGEAAQHDGSPRLMRLASDLNLRAKRATS